MKKVLLIAFISVLSFFSIRNAYSAWTSYIIDSSTDFYYMAVQVDTNGFAQVTAYDNTTSGVNYYKFNGSGWDISSVDTDVIAGAALYPNFDLDSNNYAHISYYDEDVRRLKTATFNGTGWNIQIIDSNVSGGSDGYFHSFRY